MALGNAAPYCSMGPTGDVRRLIEPPTASEFFNLASQKLFGKLFGVNFKIRENRGT